MGAALVAVAHEAHRLTEIKALDTVPSSYGVKQMALIILVGFGIALACILSAPQVAIVAVGIAMAAALAD